MVYKTLISLSELAAHIDDPDWVIVDCRFSLADTERGRRGYLQEHIPGAVYAHLDEDLSGPIMPGVTGRHPLPPVSQAAASMGKLGIGEGVQVAAYDDAQGALAAARLWWMLRWLGHEAAAVLDGGWQRWLAEGIRDVGGSALAKTFVFPRPELVEALTKWRRRLDPSYKLLDARTAKRYRGRKSWDSGGRSYSRAANYHVENVTLQEPSPAEELRRRYECCW
jgi:thiosulfate/3-mercaptopyruvate sulfurtransferase